MARLTRKPEPKWQTLDVCCPKNGAFKRAFFVPSFLLLSFLPDAHFGGEVCQKMLKKQT